MGKISGFYTMPHPPIILPQVGKGEELKIQATTDACMQVASEIADIKPETIIIITPHGPLFRDAVAISYEKNITGDMGAFNAADVFFDLPVDISLSTKIIETAENENIPVLKTNKSAASRYGFEFKLDHGAMVPLYFVNQRYADYRLVHITYGLLPKLELYELGMHIQKAVGESDTNAVMIASGDLSHRLIKDGPYEYSEYGKIFDDTITSLLAEGKVEEIFNLDPHLIENAGECGLRSYYIMLGAMNGRRFKGNLLSYEGVFGVGYSVMSFIFTEDKVDFHRILLAERDNKFKQRIDGEDVYIKLARDSLTYYIKNKAVMDIPSYVPEEMLKMKRGVFVSIKKDGGLRGCIGTIFPARKNVALEIIHNAIEAGIHDPRFNPVEAYELKDLDFSVDILSEPEKATKDELDPKKYGVIVRKGHRTGLLLPNLEGVDTVEKQISIALQKAGISPKEDYSIEKFKVTRHSYN